MKNKIKKAVKIIRHEGLCLFAGKLTRKAFYGMYDLAAARYFKGRRRGCARSNPEERFTVKEIKINMMPEAVRVCTERFLSNTKAEILKEIGR